MKLHRIATAIALLAPGLAMADPVSVIVAIATTAATATWAKVAILMAGMVVQTARARRARRKAEAAARRAYNASLQDRSVTALRSIPPVVTVYGSCITGGYVRAIFTTDKTGQRNDGSSYTKPDALKHLVISFANHQCQALNEVYIEGVPIGLASVDGNGWVTSGEFMTSTGQSPVREVTIGPGGSHVASSAPTIVSSWRSDSIFGVGEGANMLPGSYSLSTNTITNTDSVSIYVSYTLAVTRPSVRVSYRLGTDSQTVDTYLNGVAPTQWTTNHRLRGIAYAVVTLDLENQRFQGGPPNITFDVSGKLLYDPRDATTAFKTNPALVARDYLLGEHGYGCSASDVDDTYVIAAANACDTLISLDVGGVVQTNQPKYTCNGVISTEDDKRAMFSEIIGSMCGQAHYGAKWLIQAGAWTAPVMDLGDDDLQGQISILQADEGLGEVFNGVRGTFINADKATPSDFDPYQNATFLADDGEPLWEDLALLFTNNKARARNIARIVMEQSRNGQVIRYPAKLKALPLQIGDRVRVTSAEYGFSLKTYRVTDWQSSIESPVELTLQEDTSGTYDEADAASADPTPNTDLPNPWVVAALSSLTVSTSASDQIVGSNSMRAKVSWAAITDPYIASNGSVVVRWRTQVFDPPNAWRQVVVSGDETQAFLVGVVPGSSITVEAYALNSVLNVQGPRSVVSHSVSMIQIMTPISGMTLVNTANCVQNGDAIIKTAAGTAWDAGMHSNEGFIGGAYAMMTAHPQQGRWSVMIGLSANPGASASYPGIEHALFLDASGDTVRVYRSGTDVGAFGTFAAGDVYAVVYDGRSMRYTRNGTTFYQYGFVTPSPLKFDSALYESGARISGVRFGGVSNMANGRNLIDPGSWVIGSSDTQPGFTHEGSTSESSIVLGAAPDGAYRALWRCLSNDDETTSSAGGADGGFRTARQPIDITKPYRFTVWMMPSVITPANSINSGTVYFGPGPNEVAEVTTGSSASNPYFISLARQHLAAGRWYLFVGFVLPFGSGATQLNLGGVYDSMTGQRVSGCTDFKWLSSVTEVQMRAYQYQAVSTNDTFLWGPSIELIDGGEQTLNQLLAFAQGSAPSLPLDFATVAGVNGQFTNWAYGQPRPDGWSDWANQSTTPSKETSITRTGPNAVRMVNAGSNDRGMLFSYTFPVPPRVGSYFRGSFDIYLVSYTSGGVPGYLIRLFTNSGLSSWVDTLVQGSATTTGGWQRVPFNASVGEGQTIYGVVIYMMASWSGFSGGYFIGDVIFDSLEIDLVSPSDTLQLVNSSVSTKDTGSLSSQSITVSGGIAGTQTFEMTDAAITKLADTKVRVTIVGYLTIVFKGSGFTSGTKKMLAQLVPRVRNASNANVFSPTSIWFREEPIHVELDSTYRVPFSFAFDSTALATAEVVHVTLGDVYFAVSNQLGTFSAIDAVSTATITCDATIEELRR